MLCEKLMSPRELNVRTKVELFPPISDREFWENTPKLTLEFFEKTVKMFDSQNRKMITASLYRNFYLTGDRSRYETVYFERRQELINKVFLECHYNDSRYIEDIVDLVWMILEETTWVIPPHNHYSVGADTLPVVETNYIDLFSAETACTLAFVCQTVGGKLDEISVNITSRIKARLKVMFEIFVARDDFYWMGFSSRPANWNPWICSNMLASSFMIEEDKKLLQNVVYKAMRCLDNYYNSLPQDGSIDEGALYWCMGALSLMEELWLLDLGTDGQINIFDDEKINNILEFYMKMYTGNGMVVNFADCQIKGHVFYATIYKAAKLTGNKKVLGFAKYLYDTLALNKQSDVEPVKRTADLATRVALAKSIRMFDVIKYSPELEQMDKIEFEAESDYYLEGTQVLTSRKNTDPADGLFLAAKGGHNDEHHNHNDVGSFIVYKNGTKFIVDSGNMRYRKETFSEFRYTLWSTRSAYHNVPLIDGIEQKEGKEFSAKNISFKSTEGKSIFSLDVKEAYPTDKIEKWVRTITYDKPGQLITVTEDFELSEECEYSLNFMTPQNVEKTEKGVVLLAQNGETLEITFSADIKIEVEKIESDDELTIKNWGGVLYRVSFKSKAKQDKVVYTIK